MSTGEQMSNPPPPQIALGKKDQTTVNLSHAKLALAAEAMGSLPVGASLPNTKKEMAALDMFSNELTDLRATMPKLISRSSAAQAIAVKAQGMAATAKTEVAAAKAEAAAAAEEAAKAKAETAVAKGEAASALAKATSAFEEATAAKVEAEAAREEAKAAKEAAEAMSGATEQQKERADAEVASMRESFAKTKKTQDDLIAKLTARMDQAEMKMTVPLLPSRGSSLSSISSERRVPATVPETKPEQPPAEEPKHSWFFSIFNKPKEEEEEAAPAEEVIEPACYLLFSSANQGTFFAHWSEVPVPGALAAFVPEKPVPKFKYESNGGRSEITRAVGGPNKKLFYAGWVSFVRMAFSHNARFTFLGNVNASPIAIFINMKADTSVVRLEVGNAIPLTNGVGNAIAAVAISPPLATALNVQKMVPRMFISVGEKQGAAFSLDGGQDEIEEDKVISR